MYETKPNEIIETVKKLAPKKFLEQWQHIIDQVKDKECASQIETIPDIGIIKKDGYKMYRLNKNDPATFFAGALLDCDYHPSGGGTTCAFHAYANPNGCIFVVERYGKIVSQSWAWRQEGISDVLNHDSFPDGKGHGLVCFDSCRVVPEYHDSETLRELYKEAAKLLIATETDIYQVLVGEGDNALHWDKILGESEPCDLAPEGYYSDAAYVWLLDSVSLKKGTE